MIVTCLDLSTAHLQRGTMRMLTELTCEQLMAHGWPAITVANYRHGAFVTVPPKDDQLPEQFDYLPTELDYVFGFARNLGVTLIRFDSDADELPELEAYVW